MHHAPARREALRREARRVTPRHAPDPLDELTDAIAAFTGHASPREMRERFARYLELLVQWNRTHDLVGLDKPLDIVRVLFIDSLFFLPLLPERPIRLVDIGAGAGIPGVPLHLVDSAIELTLIESRRKRVSFLSALKRELGLSQVGLLEGRAEDIASETLETKGRFDVAVTRAVAPTPKFLTTCLKYISLGGRVIVAGPPPGPELPPLPVGFDADWVPVPYPGGKRRRLFLVVQRQA
jgi:16S rRNA (guanine527-N7)-methyltransferase